MPVSYAQAVHFMETYTERLKAHEAEELVWFLEHPPLYTTGVSAASEEILAPNRFPVYSTGRGGRTTYHGPGQRVAYVMLDLRTRGRDVRAFVYALEEWLIQTLSHFQIPAERQEGRPGVWTMSGEKIAAIGVRLTRWVTSHGIAINVNPDLSHFAGIVPCGIQGLEVTSMHKHGCLAAMEEVDEALCTNFAAIFGNPLTPTQETRLPA